VGTWLNALGDADRALRVIGGRPKSDGNRAPLRNATALFTDLHLAVDAAYVGSSTQWQDVDQTLAHLEQTRPTNVASQTARELAHAVAMARIAAQRASARRDGDSARMRSIAATWKDLVAEHRALWILRSRTGGPERGGLMTSCAHDNRLIAEMEHACA